MSDFAKLNRLKMNNILRAFTTSSKMSNKCHRLEGKVAMITASTKGIGFAVARRLAQEGAKVIISSRKETNVKNAVDQLKAEGLEVFGITCHVGNMEERKKLLSEASRRYGHLDILVSNAAVNPVVGPVLDCSEAAWDKVFDINVKSTFLLLKECLPLLKKSTSGSIIMISSIGGYHAFNGLGVYCISKTALLALCKSVAAELAMDKIRVNCIAPGVIETDFSALLVKTPEAREFVLSSIPLGRLGNSEEIGSIAAFLASDDASYITGETIIASGGMNSRL